MNKRLYNFGKAALLPALSFILHTSSFNLAFADPPASTRYQVFTTGTNNLSGQYLLSGTGALLGGTNGAVFNLGGFTFSGQLPGTAVSGTVPAAAVSGSAAQSGTNGFVLNTASYSGTLTITSSNTVLLDGTAIGGSGVTFPLVSADGKLSFGSAAGTAAYIDDSGNALVHTLSSDAGAIASDGAGDLTITGNNSTDVALSVNSIATAETFVTPIALMFNGMASGSRCVFAVGQTPTNKNACYMGLQWSGTGSYSNFMTYGFFYADYLMNIFANGDVCIGTTSDDGIHLLQVNGAVSFDGPVQMIDDSSRPTNSSTPAGYYHTQVSGNDAWVPYYQ